MLPMSEPNGSTNLADGDECGIANPPSNSSQSASLQQAPWAMEKRWFFS